MNYNKDVTNIALDKINRQADIIREMSCKAVHPYRSDGYYNVMTRYGTSKDSSEQFQFQPEPDVPDNMLTMYYEYNGLFARIIDIPAIEAVKHSFTLKDVKDQKILDFCYEALEELDWEQTAETCIKWTRLFGGAIAVMLINDGRGLEEPLDWKNIKSIDDIRVYDRSLIQPDYNSMFSYTSSDPFRTRGSRLGMPEYYRINSKYGSFTVHDSRCLVFQNGILPENCDNSIYQLWGMPEYIRINRALRDVEIAHRSAPKMLDKSVQPVYKMSNLSTLLGTEQGENMVLKRLQVIDMARSYLNSLVIDNDGEEYDFRTFQFAGVSDVINASCNLLSALTSIPQTKLFGRSPAGMNASGKSDMENYYGYVAGIQKLQLKPNLRYLLSVVFQAGLATKEIDEMPKIRIEFNPLWSLSESEKASLEQQREVAKQTKAATAQIYVSMGALDPSEVRKSLAQADELDVENILDDINEDDLFAGIKENMSNESDRIIQGQTSKGETVEHGNSPDAAPAATKLPQDMNDEDKERINNGAFK